MEFWFIGEFNCMSVSYFNWLSSSMAGASRSVTMVVAYLTTISELPWRDCLTAVRAARRQANPNLGFQQQLEIFEKEDLKMIREKLFIQFPDYHLSQQDMENIRSLIDAFEQQLETGKNVSFYDNLPPSVGLTHLGIPPDDKEAQSIQDIVVSPGGSSVGFSIPGNRSGKRYFQKPKKSDTDDVEKSNHVRTHTDTEKPNNDNET